MIFLIWSAKLLEPETDPSRSTTFPSLSNKNFVKFHLIPLVKNPPPFFWALSQVNTSCSLAPFTSIFWNKSPVKPFFVIKSIISWSDPGSCFPNWLQGKARTLSCGNWSRSCWSWNYMSTLSCGVRYSERWIVVFVKTIKFRFLIFLMFSEILEWPWISLY